MNKLFYILPLTLLLAACGSSSTPSATTVTTSTPVSTTTSGSESGTSTGTNTTSPSSPSNSTSASAPASSTSTGTSTDTSTTTTSSPDTATSSTPTTTSDASSTTGTASSPSSTPISISTPVTTTPTDSSHSSGATPSAPTTPSVVNQSTTGQYLSPTAAESTMLSLVNQVRGQGYTCNGVYYPPAAPLTWNSALGQSAQQYAEVMSATHNFAHDGLDGSTLQDRIKAAGYTKSLLFAENISQGATQTDASIKAVMQAWLDSTEGHCENIMDPKLKDVGIGYAADSTDAQYSYWVQDFGG